MGLLFDYWGVIGTPIMAGVFMFQGFYIATEEGRGIPLFNGLPIASIKKKDEINLVYSLSSA